MHNKLLFGLLFVVMVISPTAPATAATTAKGTGGQILTADKTRNLSPAGAWITIRGRNFDETVGIYVALCVIPKKGKQPTPCGGGVDTTGKTKASVWMSSNPPAYGVGLAKPFKIGGNFTVKIKVGPKVGNQDCRKVKCAISTRADHLQSTNRSADVFLPITFRTKK